MEDDLGVFVNNGMYAFVLLSRDDDKYVYRCELAETKTQRELVALQNSIHRKLSDLAPAIPAFIGEQWTTYSRLSKQTQVYCRFYNQKSIKNLRKAKLNVVKIERGPLKLSEVINEDNFATIAFLLYWTIWTCNSQLGFRHRDIKPDNIVVKETSQSFHFTITANLLDVRFRVSHVPLLIDFGFASLDTTQHDYRHPIGTVTTAPPEFLAFKVLFETYTVNVACSERLSNDAYDVWSLAMTLLSALSRKFSILYLSPDTVQLHIDELIGKRNLSKKIADYNPEFIFNYRLLFKICLFQKAIGNGLFPPKHLLGDIYSRYIFSDRLESELEFFDVAHQVSEIYRERWNNLGLSLSLQDIFKNKLLSWDPDERCYGGKLYKLFPALLKDISIEFDDKLDDHVFRAKNKPLWGYR